VIPDPWENTPRLLSELCEGHGQFMLEVYALDYPSGSRTWVCKSCWIDLWHRYGKPPQGVREVGA